MMPPRCAKVVWNAWSVVSCPPWRVWEAVNAV